MGRLGNVTCGTETINGQGHDAPLASAQFASSKPWSCCRGGGGGGDLVRAAQLAARVGTNVRMAVPQLAPPRAIPATTAPPQPPSSARARPYTGSDRLPLRSEAACRAWWPSRAGREGRPAAERPGRAPSPAFEPGAPLIPGGTFGSCSCSLPLLKVSNCTSKNSFALCNGGGRAARCWWRA